MNTQHHFKTTSQPQETALQSITGESAPVESQQERTFTSADLWNIQRHKKMIVRRRYLG